ncbi:cytidine deaminase [Thermatribacter velox]|uniref:Endoribonuclease YbeY n=1 Tax=Thermatribacter velox TaxID=3039681 RepID=A0ABZ2Y889_9BACT
MKASQIRIVECGEFNLQRGVILKRKFEKLLQLVLKGERRDLSGILNLVLVDTEKMRELKERFFGKRESSDVMSFFYGEEEDQTWGEVIICIPVALEQAKVAGNSIDDEISLLFIHGLLHCLGYDDQEPQDLQVMSEKQEHYLNAFKKYLLFEKLINKALKQLDLSYAPYSGYRVASALLCTDGTIVTGVNVENASFGLSICAERVAVSKAVSMGKRDFEAIAIVSEKRDFCYPCGACLQVLTEFSPGIKVLVARSSEDFKVLGLEELLPHSFSLKQ